MVSLDNGHVRTPTKHKAEAMVEAFDPSPVQMEFNKFILSRLWSSCPKQSVIPMPIYLL